MIWNFFYIFFTKKGITILYTEEIVSKIYVSLYCENYIVITDDNIFNFFSIKDKLSNFPTSIYGLKLARFKIY